MLDDIETFNTNSLNAILKIIEEPADNNFFILINNKTKPLLETIKSRCLELKIFFDFKKKENISNFLFEYFKQNKIFKHNIIDVSPGLFLKYNYIFTEKKSIFLDLQFFFFLSFFPPAPSAVISLTFFQLGQKKKST